MLVVLKYKLLQHRLIISRTHHWVWILRLNLTCWLIYQAGHQKIPHTSCELWELLSCRWYTILTRAMTQICWYTLVVCHLNSSDPAVAMRVHYVFMCVVLDQFEHDCSFGVFNFSILQRIYNIFWVRTNKVLYPSDPPVDDYRSFITDTMIHLQIHLLAVPTFLTHIIINVLICWHNIIKNN